MRFERFPGGTVLFEVDDLQTASDLCERLLLRWDASVEQDEAATLVAVALPPSPADVDALLRIVEEWLDRRALPLIRFYLDGQLYVLQRGGQIGPAGPRD